ncbi:hypothetical protein OZX67_00540 [Bifidobacterium sp. ESL0728]|uniref:hypothetical protein n=1 Tax=Bifidobacterium sp. ESL0728 TaxID=2983220 RepID=UPI0023F7BEF8|nr:hypothetical protein [Bifidobacterium sp. ESL0728]WEV59107.1 hypothetical protein OZX67_00540 [Bifidobacterium sp. ESL0728]
MTKTNTAGNRIAWLRRITHDDSINSIARRTNIPYATLYKRFQSDELTTNEIITIARCYGINPINALVDTKVISTDEASGVRGNNSLRLCSIESLADEIVRRSGEGAAAPLNTVSAD